MMRCLTLADRLRRDGAAITFICRDLPGNLCRLIEGKGYPLHLLPGEEYSTAGHGWEDDVRRTREISQTEGDIDCLIVDHYGLDIRWESALRESARAVVVIDDLANRRHDCDLLLDQNLVDQTERRYDRLVSERCHKLLGPTYALLRPEFADARDVQRPRQGMVSRILLFFGGADPYRVTSKAMDAGRLLNRPDIVFDIVIGGANPHYDHIKNLGRYLPNCTCYHAPGNMAELMIMADLAVGAGGSTTWERCCVGLPTLVIASTIYEAATARAVERAGAGCYLGMHHEVTPFQIASALERLLYEPEAVRSWSEQAAELVDGRGTDRVCRGFYEICPAEVVK
jgi:UDP-2,4-diacetamido-2,4,6-trideoxy-beta-L-altropyranose hydrolase